MANERNYCASAREYAEQVVSGTIPACGWVKKACKRQLDDLAREWDWKFDEGRGNQICAFIERMPHVKGRWSSKTIRLEPWQCFVLTTVFGWVDANGFRRFRKVLVVVPRKNAKTTIAAGVGLYMLAMDHEPGAEVYSAATTRDQAKISWEIAKRMVERTPEFRDRYGISPLAHSIAIESEGACFKPLSRDSDSLEGLNPHAAIIDELHAHKTREVYDVLDEATGSRSQPLCFTISTEGDQSAGIFVEQVNYIQQILGGDHQDDSYFGIIYTVDAEDDWTDPATWSKANPNLHVCDARGVPVLLRDMESRCRRAKKDPASQSSFKTKRLNIRVGAGTAYFNLLAWDQLCKKAMRVEDFLGEPNIVTIDLASKSDLTTAVKVFRGTGRAGELGHYYVFGSYYLPEDALNEGNPNYDFYRGWREMELLTVTPGPRTDYEFLEKELMEFKAKFRPERVGLDPGYNAEQFRQHMEREGVQIAEIPHTVLRFSEPMKELAALIMAGKVHHDGDPILRWAIGNVAAKEDVKGNVYPRKPRPENKIDPAVMLIANMGEQFRMINASAYGSLPASKIAI